MKCLNQINRGPRKKPGGQGVSLHWAQEADAADLADMNLAFNGCRREEQAVRDALSTGSELVAIAQLDGACAVGVPIMYIWKPAPTMPPPVPFINAWAIGPAMLGR